MAIGYRALDKPPTLPNDIGQPGIAPPAKFVSLFQYLIQLSSHLLKIGDVLNNTQRGKLNCTSEITLAANAATTTITNNDIGGNSTILPMPTTANAAAELPTLHFDTFAKGSCVAHHSNAATTDRTFMIAIIG